MSSCKTSCILRNVSVTERYLIEHFDSVSVVPNQRRCRLQPMGKMMLDLRRWGGVVEEGSQRDGKRLEIARFKNEMFPIQVEESRGSRVNDEADYQL